MVGHEKLKELEFFKDLTDEELKAINGVCTEESYEAGKFIFRVDEPARYLYVLEDGRVSIDMKLTRVKHVSVLTLSGRGECFGWSAMIEPYRFSASARCIKDSTVLSIDCKGLLEIFEKDFRMGFVVMRRIAKVISERVANTRQQLMNCHYGE